MLTIVLWDVTPYSLVGFEVLIAAVMKSSIFWDITSCSLSKVNQCLRGTCCFHAGCLLGLFFEPEDVGDMILQIIS
jgi:nitrate reductase gamma subunit